MRETPDASGDPGPSLIPTAEETVIIININSDLSCAVKVVKVSSLATSDTRCKPKEQVVKKKSGTCLTGNPRVFALSSFFSQMAAHGGLFEPEDLLAGNGRSEERPVTEKVCRSCIYLTIGPLRKCALRNSLLVVRLFLCGRQGEASGQVQIGQPVRCFIAAIV